MPTPSNHTTHTTPVPRCTTRPLLTSPMQATTVPLLVRFVYFPLFLSSRSSNVCQTHTVEFVAGLEYIGLVLGCMSTPTAPCTRVLGIVCDCQCDYTPLRTQHRGHMRRRSDRWWLTFRQPSCSRVASTIHPVWGLLRLPSNTAVKIKIVKKNIGWSGMGNSCRLAKWMRLQLLEDIPCINSGRPCLNASLTILHASNWIELGLDVGHCNFSSACSRGQPLGCMYNKEKHCVSIRARFVDGRPTHGGVEN